MVNLWEWSPNGLSLSYRYFITSQNWFQPALSSENGSLPLIYKCNQGPSNKVDLAIHMYMWMTIKMTFSLPGCVKPQPGWNNQPGLGLTQPAMEYDENGLR